MPNYSKIKSTLSKEINSLYQKNESEGILLRSYCAYFDILGFKEKIIEQDLDFFSKYLTVLQTIRIQLQDNFDIYNLNNSKSFEFKIFTDNFVIAHPINRTDGSGEFELGTILSALSLIQYNFVKENIFMRGAISISDMYMDDNIVLGPALIEAYKLESESSIFPRVILSNDVVTMLRNHISCYKNKEDFPRISSFLIDKDGYYFINYLAVLIKDEYTTLDNVFKGLESHKKSILFGLNHNINNFKVFEKYSWVARYHNFFCKEFVTKLFPNLNVDKVLIDEKSFDVEMSKII